MTQQDTDSRVYAEWHGGLNYTAGGIEDREAFFDRDAAEAILVNRAQRGHWQPQAFNYVHRPGALVLTPCADEGAYMDLYATADSEDIIGRLVLQDDGTVTFETG